MYIFDQLQNMRHGLSVMLGVQDLFPCQLVGKSADLPDQIILCLVQQVIFIPVMQIEGPSVDHRPLRDVVDLNFLKGLFVEQIQKSAAYRKTLNAQTEKPVPFPVKVVMWLFMAVLYVVQTSCIWYRESTAPAGPAATAWIGAVIMCCGICIEALADKQKSDAKKKNPNTPAMTGLYKYSRCPNYFGEILFWTGVFVSGWNILKGAQWVIAVLGYVTIFFIMVSGAQRLEKRQNKNYANLKEYQRYADSTPILIPFIPVYHLVKKNEE